MYSYERSGGVTQYFLGIGIAQNHSRLYLSLQKYALEIIAETGMLGAKPVSILLEPNYQLAKSIEPLFGQQDPFRRLIGKLIYLTLTPLKLSYPIHILA